MAVNEYGPDHERFGQRVFSVAVLLFGTFCVAANYTIMITALPPIMRDLRIDTDSGQWLTTGFLMANGMMIPIAGALMHRIRSGILYTAALVVFLIGTVLSAAAPNFSFLLAGRLIQALATGIIMPLMQAILLLIFPEHRKGAAMGLNGLVLALARVAGPVTAGWIIDRFPWRLLISLFIPLMVAALILTLAGSGMKKVIPLDPQPLDFPSLALSMLGFGSLLYGCGRAGRLGWLSPSVLAALAAGIVCVAWLARRSFKIPNPMVNVGIIRSPLFALSVAFGGILTVLMSGGELILPVYIQNVRGESAFLSGLVILPGALVMAAVNPLAGLIFDRVGIRRLAATGMGVLTLATLPFVFLSETTGLIFIAIVYAVRFLGIALVMMPMTAAGMATLPKTMMSDASAVTNTGRTVIGSLGTAVMVSVMSAAAARGLPEKQLLAANPALARVLQTHAALEGIRGAFLIAVGFSVLAWALTFFLSKKGNDALRRRL